MTKDTVVYGSMHPHKWYFTVESLVRDDAMDSAPVHFRAGSRAPRVGDALGIWTDGSTEYVVAPSK